MKRYSITYLGTIPAHDEHIRSIIRSALKGTGFCLRQCGRNPNRKQFYHLHPNRARHTWSKTAGSHITHRGGLQQDLPLVHATSVALYLKPNRAFASRPTVEVVKGLVARALRGQPCNVSVNSTSYVTYIKNVNQLHVVVGAIGKACKILASA